MSMQLPDEAISYQYQSLLVPASEEWTPAAELRARHLLPPAALKDLMPRLLQVRSQVATERELKNVPPELQPLDAGFIDLPQKTLEQDRRQKESSPLGRILARAARLREQADRVVILGAGGSSLGARALFGALRPAYHNELSPRDRPGTPRVYFEGDCADNDTLHELLELLQLTCVDPETRDERWAAVVVSRSGDTLETAAAYRALRREAAEYYGNHSPWIKEMIVPVTGRGGRLRQLCHAEGYTDDEIFPIPEDVGGRFSVFTAAGLLPAAVMGLDVRALLLGAQSMTRRFLEDPFERNPVLQYAAVNYLMAEQCDKPLRVLSVWSNKLEALGLWHDHLVAESLGKRGAGPTPLTTVMPRDLHTRGQLHQEGRRDKLINNLVVGAPRHPAIMVGMMDRNEDDLNQFNRRGLPDLVDAARRGANLAYHEAGRPTADLIVPTLSEHTLGQLMQLLMLATVVEGRLMGTNPYGQPGTEAARRHMRQLLRS